MNPPRPPKPAARPPRWSSPLWYLPFMLLVLWLWQGTVVQFAYRTVPYSAFKEYLRKGEVVECTVKQDVIEGKIVPKPSNQPETATNAAAASTNEHGLFAAHNKPN